MMAQAHPADGKLKDLLGDMSVTVRREISGERLAIGRCFLPSSRMRSQWISSETIRASRVSSASRSSSSRRKTVPPGFCGLQRKKRRVFDEIAFSRKSKSKTQRPSRQTQAKYVCARG